MKIIEAIKNAEKQFSEKGIASARWDAELLLAHVLLKDRTWVFTHVQDTLESGAEILYQQLIDRRACREPLQYIVGKQEFWGLEFMVTQDVLIPRPETELVVEAAIGCLRGASTAAILDLCTGSGCIAVSLAKEFPAARVFAADRSAPALAVARENARKHGVNGHIRFLEGDLFGPLEELDLCGQIDVITANPPYIGSGELGTLQPEVRDFEPEMALISGPAGTEFHKRIISEAPAFLKQAGTLIMEMGIGQAETLIAMADETRAYKKPEVLKDLAGIERVILLRRK